MHTSVMCPHFIEYRHITHSQTAPSQYVTSARIEWFSGLRLYDSVKWVWVNRYFKGFDEAKRNEDNMRTV